MLRAKFENLQDQREFFVSVKNKLGMGSTKLSRLINVPNRLRVDWWSMCRCSPPVWVIEELSNISGIKPPKFEIINGQVIRKKRKILHRTKSKFLSISLEDSIKILKLKFGNHFQKILKLIQENRNIKDIVATLKADGFKFNNTPVFRAIGTLRKSITLPIVDSMKTDGCVILRGNVFLLKKSFVIIFCSEGFIQKLNKKQIRIGAKFNKDFKSVKIFPLNIGRLIGLDLKRWQIKIGLPKTLPLKNKSKINIIINPKEFGAMHSDFVQDKDGRKLGEVAEKRRIKLSPVRNTFVDEKGDIVFEIDNKKVIVEITRSLHPSKSRFKIGQCLIQSIVNPDAIRFIVCKPKLFSNTELKALEFIKTNVVFTKFNRGWERKVIDKIVKVTKEIKNVNDYFPNKKNFGEAAI